MGTRKFIAWYLCFGLLTACSVANVDDERGASEATDCNGQINGRATEDNCGVCDNIPANDCTRDCEGVWGGDALADNCGTCDNDPTNDCVQDCTGEWGGSALSDHCTGCFLTEDARNESGCRVIFVTEGFWSGNLEGLEGADSKCQTEADEADLRGTFRAWLSGSNQPAGTWETELSQEAPIHVTKAVPDENGVIGTEIAENLEAFKFAANSETPLQRQINYYATGYENNGNETVWTGIEIDGSPSRDQKFCPGADGEAWTSDDEELLGIIGYHQTTRSEWLNSGDANCSTANRLYCLQVSHESP